MAELTLSGVIKRFGAQDVIKGVNLAVDPGEFVVFVGPSGCGKSTLLRMIAGLESVSEGEIGIGGRIVTHEEPYDRGIAMVFQSYALYPHMTVAENMGFALRLQGVPLPDRRAAVRKAAEILRIEALLDRKPAQLSGGQRQRVAIGRAIVRKPNVFLFDEPLSNLDAELRHQMRLEIARLHRALGATMVYVTHDQTEAMTLADRIVVLRAGQIEQIGRPIELYDDPDNVFVAGFIGSPRMNILPCRSLGSGAVDLAGHRIPVPGLGALPPPGTEMQIGFRPEHLNAPDAVPLRLRVDVVELLGATAYAHGEIVPGFPVVAELREFRPAAGESVTLGLDPARVYLFDRDGKRLR
jgi:lactose/L-arabinose transport system ATP-binding protein